MNAKFRHVVFVCAVLVAFLTTAATSLAQKLLNPSFEYPLVSAGGGVPDDWFSFSSTNAPRIGVTIEYRKAGVQSCRFQAQPETNAYQGIAQRFEAQPGKTYSFTAYVRGESKSPLIGGAYGQVSLEWQDANGVEIRREHGPIWGSDLAPDYWSKFTVDSIAPEGAVYGVAVVTFFSNQSGGNGIFYVDDVELKMK